MTSVLSMKTFFFFFGPELDSKRKKREKKKEKKKNGVGLHLYHFSSPNKQNWCMLGAKVRGTDNKKRREEE